MQGDASGSSRPTIGTTILPRGTGSCSPDSLERLESRLLTPARRDDDARRSFRSGLLVSLPPAPPPPPPRCIGLFKSATCSGAAMSSAADGAIAGFTVSAAASRAVVSRCAEICAGRSASSSPSSAFLSSSSCLMCAIATTRTSGGIEQKNSEQTKQEQTKQ